MERPLRGEVALVTGSGRGIGYAVAGRLAELGAAVALHDRDSHAPAEFGEARDLEEAASRLRRFDVNVVAVTGDVADGDAVRAMQATVEATLGPIGILVNCAGGDIAARGGKPKPNNALGVPIEDVQAILNRNLIGTMLSCQAICPGMAERRRGSVVNIGSIAAHNGGSVGVAYSVAKAAVVHFTRCLSRELRPFGVRVNAISPGNTVTARFLNTRTVDPKSLDRTVPLERCAYPDEIADAVAFFCGDASRFISGQVLRVDGGGQLFPA
jgi:3-oxoacyl-[acyl-carrier protein] reductase